MSDLPHLPPTTERTRRALQRVAVHVLARRRQAVTGRFGLRPAPGGVATPAFGDDEVLRTAGRWLLHERRDAAGALRTTAVDLTTSSLAQVAVAVGVDLDAELSVGHDTPPVGDADAPLGVDEHAALALARWWWFGAQVLDRVVAALPADASPTVAQLWPEHFDLGLDVGVGGDGRANLGVSPGDDGHDRPYLYVGPWGDERPGDPGYWNAPFGALVDLDALAAAPAPALAAEAFVLQGLTALRTT